MAGSIGPIGPALKEPFAAPWQARAESDRTADAALPDLPSRDLAPYRGRAHACCVHRKLDRDLASVARLPAASAKRSREPLNLRLEDVDDHFERDDPTHRCTRQSCVGKVRDAVDQIIVCGHAHAPSSVKRNETATPRPTEGR